MSKEIKEITQSSCKYEYNGEEYKNKWNAQLQICIDNLPKDTLDKICTEYDFQDPASQWSKKALKIKYGKDISALIEHACRYLLKSDSNDFEDLFIKILTEELEVKKREREFRNEKRN